MDSDPPTVKVCGAIGPEISSNPRAPDPLECGGACSASARSGGGLGLSGSALGWAFRKSQSGRPDATLFFGASLGWLGAGGFELPESWPDTAASNWAISSPDFGPLASSNSSCVSGAYHVHFAEGSDECHLRPLEDFLHGVLVLVDHEADRLAVFVHHPETPDFAESGQQAEQLVCVRPAYSWACLQGSRGRIA